MTGRTLERIGGVRARVFGALVAIIMSLAAPVAAQQTEIQQTIGSQLQAFNDRDVGSAFTYASPMIQGMFGTAENFGIMVQNGYPMVWTNADVQFRTLREEAGALYQTVMLRDTAGALHVLEYKMINLDGMWRIDGVSFLPVPDLGV